MSLSGLSALGAISGLGVTGSGTIPPLSVEIDPTELTFTESSRTTISNIFSTGFEALDTATLADLTYDSGTSIPTQGSEVITVTGADFALLKHAEEPAFPWFAVEIDVESLGTAGVAACGAWKDNNNRLIVYSDGSNVAPVLVVEGVTVLSSAAHSVVLALALPYKLAVSVHENVIGLWYDSGSGWVCARAWNVRGSTDMTVSGYFSGWKYSAYIAGSGIGSFSKLKAGFSGEFGISSQYLVTKADGSMLRNADKCYMLCTVAGLEPNEGGGALYRPSHFALYERSLANGAMTLLSHILTQRSGKTLGDAYGQGIYDDVAEVWRLYPQDSGTYSGAGGITYQYTTAADLLTPGVYFVNTPTTITFPTAGNVYDTAVRGSTTPGTVYFAATEVTESGTVFTPTLYAASDFDGTAMEVVDAATGLTGIHEGARFIRLGSSDWVTWSGGTGMRVHNLAMVFAGTLTIDDSPDVPPSHAEVVPLWIGSRTGFQIETFDTHVINAPGVGSTMYGKRLVFDSSETFNGRQV